MKKWLVIALVIAGLLLMVARALFIRIGRAKKERPAYVKTLDFHFSAYVDSLKVFSRTNGLVYFHTIKGELNLSTEDRMNQKLKYNGSLRFVLPINGKSAFHSRDLDKYQLGDSLVFNSDLDKIYIYRQSKLTAESEISQALSGRPFKFF